MATMDFGSVTTEIGKYGREFAPVTFAAGFVYGATNDITYSGSTSFMVTGRVQDTIARVTGVQLNLGGGKSPQTQTMNIGNIMNGGTYGAVGLEVAHALTSNKWVKLAKDVFQPPLAGYGIGKVFDAAYKPNIPGSQANLPTTASWQGT